MKQEKWFSGFLSVSLPMLIGFLSTLGLVGGIGLLSL